ncbi:MAG: 5-(carboxyamino)imidazole ribonucleotide mutase [Candidatus Doudnabacteria bacterium CG10_big_fil_rev_8_21_14_0_10_42_18]|uniref:N5-carboxyaminoimidazole ribonucleotide mutase n=1 Tax=Candidatus Doudnabacteria bacterium CG10_big_fil_rev_8_21_14_0_10_42_18 TaxID=1974552 RepID=A0A2H0VBY0_9BACT|nr:MAG: 5-(carboxyamino)imidazole ribonucleotide mutase [Candidatus Doudnabacteria bacterium CG10_big_fil_rev_8_21_14_0_10_42_18]
MKPQVAILMGSDSDLKVMSKAAEVLENFKVPYEITVLSAHRTHKATHDFASTASKKGFKAIIAGAGGAAHLAGVMAANTTLPVIGVPIDSSPFDGLDSLLATVQMPSGIPVATVGVDSAKNAGLLAVEILATGDKKLAKKMIAYKKNMAKKNLAKGTKLKKLGYRRYLENNKK